MAVTNSVWFSLGLLMTQSIFIVCGQGTASIMPSSTLTHLATSDSLVENLDKTSANSSPSLPVLKASSEVELSISKDTVSTEFTVVLQTSHTMSLAVLPQDSQTAMMSNSVDAVVTSNLLAPASSSIVALSASQAMSPSSSNSSIIVLAFSTQIESETSTSNVMSDKSSINAEPTSSFARMTVYSTKRSTALPSAVEKSESVTPSSGSQSLAVTPTVTDTSQSKIDDLISSAPMSSSSMVIAPTSSTSMMMSLSESVFPSASNWNKTDMSKAESKTSEGGMSSSGQTVVGVIIALCLVMLLIGGVVLYKRQNFTHRSLRAFLTSSVKYKTYSNASYKDEEVADLGFYN